MDENPAYICPRCGIGNCQPEQTTYTRMYKGHLVSVPHMTRYTCDVCGFTELDQGAINHLYFMLGHSIPMHSDKRPMKAKKSLEPPDSGTDSGTIPRPKP